MQVHRKNFDQIVAQGRQLSSLSDGQTAIQINEITHRIQQQWTTVEQHLQEIIQPAKDIVETWRSFNTSYVYLLDRLGELETRWYSIQRDKFTNDIETLMDRAKVIRFESEFFLNSSVDFLVQGLSRTSSTIGQRNNSTLRTNSKVESTFTIDRWQKTRNTVFSHQESAHRIEKLSR